MVDGLLLFAVFASAYAGFACFALSQKRHWRRVRVREGELPRAAERALRTLGAVLLVLSLALALGRDGPSFGSLLWATAISLAALAVAFTLAWRPTVLRAITAVGCVLVTPCGARRS